MLYIRIQDAVKFVKSEIAKNLESDKEFHRKYEAAAIVYEAKFLPRLFGWKFKNSFAGDTSWLNGNWDFDWFRTSTETHRQTLLKFEYQSKCGITLIPSSEVNEAKFYKFAQENDLPY